MDTHTPLSHTCTYKQVKPVCVETLMLIAERMTLNYASLQVMKASFDQKSPKVCVCVCVCVSVLTLSMPWLSSKISRKLCIEYKRLVLNPHINSYWLMETTDTSG